jgi:small multidrug resistance pump
MSYIYLALAVVAEVVATSALKRTEEFTRLLPSLVVLFGYTIAFYFLTLVLRSMPVGVTYVIWSGLGVTLVTMTSAILYREVPDLPASLGMTLIVAGVMIMNLLSKSVAH